LELVGCPSHTAPVAYGANPFNTFLDPSAGYQGAVSPLLKAGVNTFLSGCLNMTLDLDDHPSPYYATELITGILRSATEPVNILILGTFTNLAHVIISDRSLLSKIATVWVSGGNFDGRPMKPASWPYTTKTSGASWNIFADPLAAQLVLESGVPIYMFTSTAQGTLPVNATSIDQYVAQYSVDPIWGEVVGQLGPCSNQSGIDYWDPSAAMIMEELLTGVNTTICTNTQLINATIVLTEGGMFGRSISESNGNLVTICTAANETLFESRFWQALGNTNPECLVPVTFVPVDIYAFQTILDTDSQTVAALQLEVDDLKQQLLTLETTIQQIQKQQQPAPAISGDSSFNVQYELLLVSLIIMFVYFI